MLLLGPCIQPLQIGFLISPTACGLLVTPLRVMLRFMLPSPCIHPLQVNAGIAQTACGLVVISAFTLVFSPGKGWMGGIGTILLFYCLMVSRVSCH